ncbi:MAG: efflux RND transporter permease subunit, partial [Alphaproteobacteria bacterium]
MSVPRLNLAGRLASSFITSKLTIVFIVGVLMAGVFAVALTPREENPQIVVPGAVVTVALPGASAQEVDQLIVGPLEGILSEMSGVDHTYGVARNSLGAVQVQFKVGESPEDSLVKLYNRVMANRERLPAGAGIPTIRAVDADDVPVVTVTLASNAYDDYGLKRVADRMAERLRSLPDVSVVSVRGGRDREIGVAFDPERLVAFSIALPQAYAAITANNLSTPLSGPLRNGKVETVQLRGAFASVDDVRDLVVGVHAGRPVYVRDVAIVTDGPPIEITAQSRFAFGSADARAQHAGTGEMPAVTIAVAKKKGANAVLVSRSVVDRIDRMQQSFVPKGIHV